MKLRELIISALATVIIAVLTISCKDKDPGPQPFPLPQVPSLMTSGPDVQNYMVTHYWQPFFAEGRIYSRDTTLIGGVTRDDFRDAYTNYATMLMTADVDKALKAQENLMAAAEKLKEKDPQSKVLESLLSIADAMLYDPQSPIRNEEMYIPVEEARANSKFTSQEEKADAEALLPRLKLNRLGTQAANFAITQSNGRKINLHDIQANILVLLFSNPGCENCKEVIDRLKSLNLDAAIAAKTLAIVNVYPDADLQEWKAYAPNYPSNWVNGYNAELDVAGGLYNLRAIPSLYVLDENKNVVFKDVDPVILVSYLRPLSAQ